MCMALWKRCLNSVGKFEEGAFPGDLKEKSK